MEKTRVGVIGGGSWGTALVSVLLNNLDKVNWWVRQPETLNYIKEHRRNPNYLSYLELPVEKIHLSTHLSEIISKSDVLILAVPAAFLKKTFEKENIQILKDKIIVSAIKGIVPETHTVVGQFLHDHYQLDFENFGVIAGPCHSEEVAMQKLSFLTISFSDSRKAEWLSGMLSTWFLKVSTSNDIVGAEYAAVIKNIIALANGICVGIGYGDNFQAVLISNAIREMERFVAKMHPVIRDINESVYIGDVIVTAYSKFSRNRMFGTLIGKGYSIQATMAEMNMVAEGYYAVKCIHQINKNLQIDMPVCETVYRILYENAPAVKQMKLLAEKLT